MEWTPLLTGALSAPVWSPGSRLHGLGRCPLRRCFRKSVNEGCAPHTPRIGINQSALAVSGLSSTRHSQEVLAPEDVGRNGRGQRVEPWQWGPGLSRTLMAQ